MNTNLIKRVYQFCKYANPIPLQPPKEWENAMETSWRGIAAALTNKDTQPEVAINTIQQHVNVIKNVLNKMKSM